MSWLTFLCGHVYQKYPVVHLLPHWITDYPCMQTICAYINVYTTILPFSQAGRLFFQSQQQAVHPTVIFASDAVESIVTLVPVHVCMFTQSWSLWLAMFESNLCTSFAVWVFMAKRGERVWTCAVVIIYMLGERRETVFLQSQCVAMM